MEPRGFLRFKCSTKLLGKFNPSLTSLSFNFELEMDVWRELERESVMASFEGSIIYHRVQNGEMRLTVVSVFGLVAGKV